MDDGCMGKGERRKEILAIAIASLLVIMIFLILIPPATAVYLHPGTPNSTSAILGTTVTFSNVNLTIRGYEKIPVNNLTFTIYNNVNDQQVGYVLFYINGTEIEDYPSNKFTVTNTTAIGAGWNDYGFQNGTDEYDNSEHSFGYGYGYGYGSGSIDVTFLYTITYKTHTTGRFYAKLSVNSTNYTYMSDKSTRFTISTTGGGGGGGGSLPPIVDEEEETTEETTKEDSVEDLFGIVLENNFTSTDINGDGVNDTFNDPNGLLKAEHNIIIDNASSFLISVIGNLEDLFLWDTVAGTITQVTYASGNQTDAVKDSENNTISFSVNVDKSNWIYIEAVDDYPDISELTVKTVDGRKISSDMIWRTNNKIFVLDDPAVEYIFTYTYDGFLFDVILELTKDSVVKGKEINALLTLINVGEPGMVNGTIEYTLYMDGSVVWKSTESVSVVGQRAYEKTISTDNLSKGEYTYEVVYTYGDNQTASSFKTFTVKAGAGPEGLPLWIPILLIIVIIAIFIVFYLFKKGILYIEKH
jgi:hypothetical protein